MASYKYFVIFFHSFSIARNTIMEGFELNTGLCESTQKTGSSNERFKSNSL